MIVLGINEAHNASAALAIDGEIIAAAQEERFSRIKNHFGVPYKAIEFCLNFAKVNGNDVDLIVFSGGVPNFITSLKTAGLEHTKALPLLKIAKNLHQKFRQVLLSTEYHLPTLRGIDNTLLELFFKLSQKVFFPQTAKILYQKYGLNTQKSTYLDHHTAHAYATLYSSGFSQKFNKVLVITCDGGGDGLSSSISLYRNNKLKRIAHSSQDNSLGVLYGSITDILGMNPLEHEYKVMGLAPYAMDSERIQKIYDFLASVISLDVKSLSFKTTVGSDNLNRYLREHLPKYRFDYLAAALQKLTEELLVTWIQAAIEKTKYHNVVFGGGVAQNVKANQKIANLAQIKNLFVMPSAGDESNCIGAAYWGSRKIKKTINLKPLKNLYLGPSYSQIEIKKVINSKRVNQIFKVSRLKNPPSQIAHLLAKGNILARFTGRMEFGARALGNRSILADPKLPEVITTINRQIKSRDFWMPFAPTILDEDASKYLINPKSLKSQFMTFAFDTKVEARTDLIGAIHSYDYTTRPQILKDTDNYAYYQLISAFKKITKRGAILNTSLNLHGEPIVRTPYDAIKTFEKSGLKYLVLEDYLVTKSK